MATIFISKILDKENDQTEGGFSHSNVKQCTFKLIYNTIKVGSSQILLAKETSLSARNRHIFLKIFASFFDEAFKAFSVSNEIHRFA